MVTQRADASTFDCYLQLPDESKVGIRLAKYEGGAIGYRPGWAPMLSPSVRQDGFNFQHADPRVDVPVAFDNWRGGCGFNEEISGDLESVVYSYSQGVDASWLDRLYLSPKANSAPTSTDAAFTPEHFSNTSLGLFLSAGRYLYEFDLTTQEWVERLDLGASNSSTGPVVEFNGNLFLPCGDSVDYYYSADGSTWTASGLTDDNAVFFTVRGRTSTTPQFWKVDSDGNLKVNTDGTGASTQWSAAVPTGHTSETVTGLLTVSDKIWVFKKEGFYTYDGTTEVDDIFKADYISSQNGKHPYLWVDGNIYVPYGDRVMVIDPATNAFSFILPTDSMLGNPEINGVPMCISGSSDALYVDLRTAAGTQYTMKGLPDGTWHTMAYESTNTSSALIVVGPGIAHSTNPCIIKGYGTSSIFYVLPRTGMRPEDDTNYLFTSTGFLVGPNISVGAYTISKVLTHSRMLTRQTSASKPVALAYDLDETGYTTILTASSPGLTTEPSADTTKFGLIRYKVTMTTGDADVSPICLATGFNTVVLPPRKRMWSIDAEVGPEQLQVGGGLSGTSPEKIENLLNRLDDSLATFYDRSARTFTVRVLDVAPAVNPAPLLAKDRLVYTLVLVETNEITEQANHLVWGRDAWSSGKTWG